VFAEAMKPYIENPAKMRSVSIYNSEYAKTHFVASVVVRKFENTLKKYIEL
ncbi:glycosyltransferase family 1 protein, partial [Bacteroides xylanisolvens]